MNRVRVVTKAFAAAAFHKQPPKMRSFATGEEVLRLRDHDDGAHVIFARKSDPSDRYITTQTEFEASTTSDSSAMQV